MRPVVLLLNLTVLGLGPRAWAHPKRTGSLRGRVTLLGKAPKPVMEVRRQDPQTCGRRAVDPALARGPHGGLPGAVVVVEVPEAKPAAKEGRLDQKGCTYRPHVQALPVGSTLALVNSDPVLHNVHGYRGDETAFNVAEPLQNEKETVHLDKVGPIHLRCDVHPWMSAWVDVVDSPYYAVTGPKGHFNISGLPPGTYPVHLWHERLHPYSLKVRIRAARTTRIKAVLRPR